MNNFAFILLTKQIFGGAERRFTQLLKYLNLNYQGKYYFIITWNLYHKILEIFPDFPTEVLIPIGSRVNLSKGNKIGTQNSPKSSIDHPNIIKKFYRFVKNYQLQKKYFIEIEKIRKEKRISSFLGVYSGIIPLYFYLMKKKREVAIIFCDMDSWFTDIFPDEKEYWYRKFSSFNYALENSDHIDFLSPFILDGVRERGINVKEKYVSITPCSFTDYSKCRIGNKKIFQVAYAGRLEKDKNPDIFIDAAIILAKKYQDIIFHIMGEGRLSCEIEERVKKSEFPNIKFHGFHRHPLDILADTSVFVSIQSTNNYPSQSVLEAMACGNAIIASDVGDTRMFINEKNGILIKLDVEDLINAIEYLYLNKDLRESLSKYASQYVRENHTIEKVSNYYINLFQSTVLMVKRNKEIT